MQPFEHVQRGDGRVRLLGFAILLGLGVLLAGLWYIQVVSAREYSTRIRQQSFRTVRVPAVRGRILDRQGVVLADNRPCYNLVLYVEELRPLYDVAYEQLRDGRRLTLPERNALRRTARFTVASNIVARLAEVVQHDVFIDENDFHRHHDQWPYRPLSLWEDADPTTVARFLEQAALLPGVDLEVLPLREYPQGPMAAHVLGYLTRDDDARDFEEQSFNYSQPTYHGAVGVERGFDEALSGEPGLKSVVVNSLCYRESETVWQTARPGRNLVLTLDAALQRAVVESFAQELGTYARGAAVVLDVRNGDVLAMASVPAFDPNEFLTPISADRWEEWMNNPTFRPIFNRATQGAYPPGSVFKIVTALACFESGVLTYDNLTNQIYNPGYYRLGGRTIDDLASAGWYDFRRGFKKSSNTYFIECGLQAGMAAMMEMGHRFFLGEGADLPTYQEVRGFFPSLELAQRRWSRGNLANVCIGQEITLTPLQVAVMTAAVANGGKVFWPRLVERIEPAEASLGQETARFENRVRGELGVETRFLDLLREAMLADTEERDGTGFKAFHARDGRTPLLKRYRVGGKTGTAEVERGGRVVDNITWFTCFGPYEAPHYAVVVMVESGTSGGGTCAPVARRIFQAIERAEDAGAGGLNLASAVRQ